MTTVTEQQYSDIADLALIRQARWALHNMSINDAENPPEAVSIAYKLASKAVFDLEMDLKKQVDIHTGNADG